jgi:hypothetical protein
VQSPIGFAEPTHRMSFGFWRRTVSADTPVQDSLRLADCSPRTHLRGAGYRRVHWKPAEVDGREAVAGLPHICIDGLLDRDGACQEATGDLVTVAQDEGKDCGSEASVVHGNHRKADRQSVVDTGPDHRQGLAVGVRRERP